MEYLIYLIRHAEPAFTDNQQMCLGQFDLGLSCQGTAQAEALAFNLKDKQIDTIITSDLLRARQTAAIISHELNLSFLLVPELREVHLGQWDGLSFDDIRHRFPEEFYRRGYDFAGYRPPGGENFIDVWDRVEPIYTEIIQNIKGNTAIVSHAGVNRLILCHLTGIPFQNLMNIKQDYACVNILSVQHQDKSVFVREINKVLCLNNKELSEDL